MDDGSLQNKGLHLSTYSFTYEEVVLLIKTLENLFAPEAILKCSIHNHFSFKTNLGLPLPIPIPLWEGRGGEKKPKSMCGAGFPQNKPWN